MRLLHLLFVCTIVNSLSAQTEWNLYQEAQERLVLLRNDDNIIPLSPENAQSAAVISLSGSYPGDFLESLRLYYSLDSYHINLSADTALATPIWNSLDTARYKVLLIWIDEGILDLSDQLVNYYLSKLKRLADSRQYICVAQGEARSLAGLDWIKRSPGLIWSQDNNPYIQKVAAQIIMGAMGTEAQINSEVASLFQAESGIKMHGGERMAYLPPESVGWDSLALHRKMDSLVFAGMEKQAFPGCQILISKNRKVVFHKAYGYHTYDKAKQVELHHLYDLASVTKISGTLPILIKLVGEKQIDLDESISTYWQYFDRKDKRDITFREALSHQARLKPYIVYWSQTLKENGKYKGGTFKGSLDKNHLVPVSPDLYLHRKYRKKIYREIAKSEMNAKEGYVYSGLSFLIFPGMIEQIVGESYYSYLRKNFYDPLGANRLVYNPYKDFPLEDIVPTENDTIFRKRLVQGWVHDEAAAMFGGVSGNAGLFSNANDLAKLMDMYLYHGKQGNHEFLDSISLSVFTRSQYPEQGNRRGLGFDKPPLEAGADRYIAFEATHSSFGHSGFTGTLVWMDPEEDLLFVLLSNRVYPDRGQRELYRMGLRPKLHGVGY